MTDTKQSRLTATLLCVTPPDEHQEQGIRAFLQKKYGEDVALTRIIFIHSLYLLKQHH